MPAPIVHVEIGCKDKARTSKFFADLFGWKIDDAGPAAMIDTGSKDGIMGHISAMGHPPHNYITFYAQVDDLAAYLKKAESLGGKTMVPPTEVPGMGHFAWFTEPEGTIIGLWKPMAR